MANMSLYRKWRPQTFDSLKGQDIIRDTISYALAHDQLSQAYLFCGPRGTGKTTTARLIAKFVNCHAEEGSKPCNTCMACATINEGSNFDIIEVDAASNRGIDEIRQLRDSVRFAPTQAKYKVFIIDEVHMLTREAFNALLKTLEEPPKHAIFILATTEAHKIPPTITSRCQRYDFRLATLETLTEHLLSVADAEGIPLSPDAAQFIARLGDGSFRDALSVLDQLRATEHKEYSLQVVEGIFGYVPQEQMATCLAAILSGNPAQSHAVIDEVLAQGADLKAFCDQLLAMTQEVLESVIMGTTDALVPALAAQAQAAGVPRIVRWIELMLGAVQQLKQSPIPRLPLDIAITKFAVEMGTLGSIPVATMPMTYAKPKEEARVVAAAAPTSAIKEAVVPSEVTAVVEPVTEAVVVTEVLPESQTVSVPVIETVPAAINQEEWRKVLDILKTETPSLVTSLSHAQILGANGDMLQIAVKFKMHADKINQVKNRTAIEQAVEQVMGTPLKIEAQIVKDLVMQEEEAVDLSEVFDFE